MSREIHEIPPAPRRVRWRAVLWHWYPLAFLGFMMAVYGGLITLMMFLAHGGKPSDDERLDRDRSLAWGIVTAIEPGSVATAPVRVSYEFHWEDQNKVQRSQRGRCIIMKQPGIAVPKYEVGQRVKVEFDTTLSHISRIEGARLVNLPPLRRIFFWAVLVPGLVFTGIWFLGVLRVRRVMGRGDIALAEIRLLRKIRYVLPSMLHVDYEFRDRNARKRLDHHWVRSRSELGERLQDNPRHVSVAFTRKTGHKSRLVIASDFRTDGTEGSVDPGSQTEFSTSP